MSRVRIPKVAYRLALLVSVIGTLGVAVDAVPLVYRHLSFLSAVLVACGLLRLTIDITEHYVRRAAEDSPDA